MSLFITQCLSFAGRADLKNNVGALLQATLIISPLFNPHTNRNVKITMCFFYGAINSLAKKKQLAATISGRRVFVVRQ